MRSNYKIKVRDILWVLLAYILFYCFNPALFPNVMEKINIILILVTLFGLVLTHKIIRKDAVWCMAFAFYAIYIILQTLSSDMVTSITLVCSRYILCPAIALIGIFISSSYSYDLTKTQDLIWRIMWGWGLVLFVLGVYETFTGHYILEVSSSVEETISSFSSSSVGIVRAMVFSKSYLLLGDLYGILAVTSFCLYKRLKNKIYLISVFVFLVGTFLGLSRGSLVGTISGFIILFLIKEKNISSKIPIRKIFSVLKWSVVVIVLIILIFTVFQSNEIIKYCTDRIITIFNWSSDYSNTTRMDHWRVFIDIWVSSPRNFLFGTGGLTAEYLSSIHTVTESGFLQHLVEIGLIGSILYYILLLYPFVKYVKSHVKTNFGNWTIGCFTILFIHDFVLQISAEYYICVLMWLFVMMMIVENRRIYVLKEKILIYEENGYASENSKKSVEQHRLYKI